MRRHISTFGRWLIGICVAAVIQAPITMFVTATLSRKETASAARGTQHFATRLPMVSPQMAQWIGAVIALAVGLGYVFWPTLRSAWLAFGRQKHGERPAQTPRNNEPTNAQARLAPAASPKGSATFQAAMRIAGTSPEQIGQLLRDTEETDRATAAAMLAAHDSPTQSDPVPKLKRSEPRKLLASDGPVAGLGGIFASLPPMIHKPQITSSRLVHNLHEFLKIVEVRHRPARDVIAEYERKYSAEVKARSAQFSVQSKNADREIAEMIEDGPKNIAEIRLILNYLIAIES